MILLHGDSLEVLKSLDANSIDSLVTDPPAAISFMGRDWDSKENFDTQMVPIFKECLRVLKPGAHGLVWALPRTSHLTATALERAGFEIIEIITHLFGSGFPKSTNILKSGQKQGIFCNCEIKDMPHLQEKMDTKGPISVNEKCHVQPDMLGEIDKTKENGNISKTTSYMSCLSKVVYTEESQDVIISEILQPSMLRNLDSEQSSSDSAFKEHCKEGDASIKSSRQQGIKGSLGCKESSLEGRSNLQEKQRELHRSEICKMSQGMDSDGKEGRLCNGTPSSNGNLLESDINSNRSGASQGPQYEKQCDTEFRTIRNQWSSQACGGCGKTKGPQGVGTRLKPSSEFWILVRKPLAPGLTIAANVLKHGVGGLNIDISRIGTKEDLTRPDVNGFNLGSKYANQNRENSDCLKNGIYNDRGSKDGRFPANLILSHNHDCVEVGVKKVKAITGGTGVVVPSKFKLSKNDNEQKYFNYSEQDGTETVPHFECTPECPVAELDAQSGIIKSGAQKNSYILKGSENTTMSGKNYERREGTNRDANSGGASRFFKTFRYQSKASKRERNEGCESPNTHPTIKAIRLMSYLIKLVTPPSGTILDPFMGSGSTGVAAIRDGFHFIGIEKELEYFAIADARIKHAKIKYGISRATQEGPDLCGL